MGFFDSLKKAVGGTGVKLEYTWIEDPLTFTDPMVKATVTVTATSSAITVLGTSARVYAQTEEHGQITLGEAEEVASEHSTTTRNGESVPVFPHTIKPGESEGFGIWVDELDLPSALADVGATTAEEAKAAGIKFMFKVEVDVKETNFMFDPVIEQEIQVT